MRLPAAIRRVASMDMDDWRGVGVELGREIVDDRIMGLAAEVAFFGVLSLFPGMLVVAAALGSIDALFGSEIAQAAREMIVDFLDQLLTANASATVAAVEDLFARQRTGLLTVSVLFAVVTLTRGFSAVITALDLAYDLEERRPWLRQRLVSLGLALGTIVMTAVVLTMLVAGPLFGGGRAVADMVGFGEGFTVFWTYLRWPTIFLLLVTWAMAMYHFAPNQRVSLLAELPGALVSSVMWFVLSIGFSLYLRLATEVNQVLGVLGGGLILLVWLYLLGGALLLGGELNAILATGIEERRRRRDTRRKVLDETTQAPEEASDRA